MPVDTYPVGDADETPGQVARMACVIASWMPSPALEREE
jgi:hypothetical protein